MNLELQNKVICGDSAKVLKELPDEIIDLTVTSPPYDDLRDYNGYVLDIKNIVKELYRITKDGGVVVWIIGDKIIDGSESLTSFKHAILFTECGFNLHDTMIFEKDGSSLPDKTRYNQAFQYMFVFSKGKPKTINLIKDRKNKNPNKLRLGQCVREKDGITYPRKNHQSGIFSFRKNIWCYKTGYNLSTKDKIAFEHPAIFPEELAKDHILSWSNESDLILDPFCGSGTTLKMAKRLNRKYIGIDISASYLEITKQRLR